MFSKAFLMHNLKCNNAYNSYKKNYARNEKSNYIIDGRMVKEKG